MNSETVVNTILVYAKDKGVALNHINVQSILYLLHGFYIARTGEPLLDNPFEAWKDGPILPKVYSALNHHGHGWVRYFLELEEKESGHSLGVYVVDKTHVEFFDTLNLVWEAYGKLKGEELFLTVRTKFNEPWIAAKWRNGIISNESILECFTKNLSELEGKNDDL